MDNHDHDLSDLLEEAVAAGLIKEGTPAHGIALRAVHSGYGALTYEQKKTYDKHAAPHLEKIGEQREVQRRINSAPD